MTKDQDTKLKFENSASGWRAAVAANSMTGERGDRVIIDDPHSVEGALSPAQRETTIRWFQETVPTRLNEPKTSAIVVIMQRLHDRDVSGLILKEDLGYTHLCLPMRYEKKHPYPCKADRRTEEGELLFPQRFPAEVVDRDEKAMGSPAVVAGQHQQRPAPRGGTMIPIAKFKIAKPPVILNNKTRYWDKAGTEGGGKRTAGVLMARDDSGKFWILDVQKGHWGTTNREARIKLTAQADGKDVNIYVEQEPGSGGKESAENTVLNLAGFKIEAERPVGDKVLRAEPFACQVDAGNVYLAEAEWNTEYIGECELFPLGRFKDQVDATSGAFNKIALRTKPRMRVLV